MTDTVIHCLLVLLMPPLLLGVIGKTKAAFAGRSAHLTCSLITISPNSFAKDRYSAKPRPGYSVPAGDHSRATLIAAALVPLGNHQAPVSFNGDMILFAYLFGLARFFTPRGPRYRVELRGMGAAREVTFPAWQSRRSFCTHYPCPMSKSLSLSPMLAMPPHRPGSAQAQPCSCWSGRSSSSCCRRTADTVR